MAAEKLIKAHRLPDGRILIEEDGRFRQAKGRTPWKKLRAMTDREITAAARRDPDNLPLDEAFWARAKLMAPAKKQGVFLKLDADVVIWFKKRGRGYQARMNAILRSYVEAQKRAG